MTYKIAENTEKEARNSYQLIEKLCCLAKIGHVPTVNQ